jgi:hypothetical protein
MIVTCLRGGLGNQLFQYAMARRLARHRGSEVLLDVSDYGTNGDRRPKELVAFSRKLVLLQFKVAARIATPAEIAEVKDDFYRATTRDRIVRRLRRVWPELWWNPRHIREKHYRFQPEALEFTSPAYLAGYWQSPKYFADVAQIIRDEIWPKEAAIEDSASNLVNGLRERYKAVVSLHVRRGDLAHAYEVAQKGHLVHGAPVTLDYIDSAIKRFDADTCFLVFSDSKRDIEWCKANIRTPNLEFSSAESELWDFCAMRLCDHHIIANSTFSWWAAWLDDKPGRRVISPARWSSPTAKVDMAAEDLIPADWELI